MFRLRTALAGSYAPPNDAGGGVWYAVNYLGIDRVGRHNDSLQTRRLGQTESIRSIQSADVLHNSKSRSDPDIFRFESALSQSGKFRKREGIGGAPSLREVGQHVRTHQAHAWSELSAQETLSA